MTFLNSLRGGLDTVARVKTAETTANKDNAKDFLEQLTAAARRKHMELQTQQLQGRLGDEQRIRDYRDNPALDPHYHARRMLLKAKHPDLDDGTLDAVAGDVESVKELMRDGFAEFKAKRDYTVAHPMPTHPRSPTPVNPNVE